MMRIGIWLIFVGSVVVIALAVLMVIWIGSKIIRSIEKHDRQDEIEREITNKVKRDIWNNKEEK